MPVCQECEGTDFDERDGLYFCQICMTQSQDLRREEEGEDGGTFYNVSSVITKKSERKKKVENKGRPWHSFEAFTIIIREQVKALIKLGASAKLKDVVLQLWCNYLSKTGTAFPEDENKMDDFMRKHMRQRERYPGSVECPDIQPVQFRKTWKKKYGVSKKIAEKDLENKKLMTALQNEEFYEGDNPTEQAVAEEPDYSSDEDEESSDPNQIRYMRRSVEFMTMLKTLCFCYIGTLYTDHLVTLSDIIRWADQKEIPYYKATSLLPTDMKFCAKDGPTFSTTVLKYENLEFETEKLIQYLNLNDVPDVSLQLLTSKYIVMLDLPGELHGFVINLIQPELRKEDDRRYNDMLAMGYIVTTLQLLLGLDDSTERELSHIAVELNNIFHNKYNMFVWSDWTTHISKKIKAATTNISDESRNIKDTKKFIEDFILFDKDKKYNAAHYKRDRTRRPETQDALLRPLETLNKALHSTTGSITADPESDNEEYNPNLVSTLADFFLDPDKEVTEQTKEKSSDFNFKSSTLKFITQPFSFQDDLDKLNLSRLSMHSMSAEDSDQEPERSDIDMFETPKKKRRKMARSPNRKVIDEHESEKLMQLIHRLGEIQESNIKVDRKKKYHELVYQAKAYQWLIKTCSDMMACSTDILNKKVIEVQNILFRHWDRSQWRRKKRLITLLKK
ncbi:TATA box-binding protein-associated factor RNA polymerase I subunit B [Mytilus galloprovincialis]|uniref:TATA box-binding protein-associated factor RNA polymerase I subunit B n=1 Tax=Mytilus galloprovincialis TaxID=29158 RepID=A0A8B6EX51_MYTGA|nr:TATA box-binding protein-associated factor RNA polymerase I subunit B [Mytilus galloprovincialis]